MRKDIDKNFEMLSNEVYGKLMTLILNHRGKIRSAIREKTRCKIE
jgi:hypothetical protein